MADQNDRPDCEREAKLLREFAHDIRTPLNAMLGYTAMMAGEGGTKLSSDQVYEYAGVVNTATRRLLEICERALDEAVKGQTVVHVEDVNFTAFCIELVGTFEKDAEDHGVRLEYAIADDFPIMRTDPVILYEIMTNLVSNAIKFTPRGGKVSVRGEVNYREEALILVIQDTGKGIPSTILMSVMKGQPATMTFAHTHRKGWGQGLLIVQEKVKQLGGELRIESAANGGTVACIHLPKD
ncbi:MAG: HAMP domain-containing histidine kinase [Alphaproteobacteria bacterium]|nr:HAMP domain-containing histidine kinase [Alphaproteobacteria bacterium]